jgi:ketosteroid isomerase-like protein
MEEARRDAGVTSDEDVIRKVNDAVANRDMQVLSERLHPDVVWEHNIGVGTLEEGVYRGREHVTQLFERILEPWEYLRTVPQEIRSVGPGKYTVRGELHAKHATTDREVVTPYEQEVEMEEGLLVKLRMITARVS